MARDGDRPRRDWGCATNRITEGRMLSGKVTAPGRDKKEDENAEHSVLRPDRAKNNREDGLRRRVQNLKKKTSGKSEDEGHGHL